jgi:WD40 repeat protein
MSRSLHRPSLIPPDEEPADGPRSLSLNAANHSVAGTPFQITTMRPFVPFNHLRAGQPFTAKKAWKGVISGIRALQRLRITGGIADGPMTGLKSDLVVVSGHETGQLMVWSADNLQAIGSATHYNNVSVAQVIVTNSLIYTRVERASTGGKAGDDTDVYVWDLNTMTLTATLSGHEDRVSSIAVSDEDEKTSASGSADRTIALWDLENHASPQHVFKGHTGIVTGLLLSGSLLVSASSDGYLKTWNVSSKSPIASHDAHNAAIVLLRWVDPYMDRVRAAKRTQPRRGSNAQQHLDGSASAPLGQGASSAQPGEDEAGPFGIVATACATGTLCVWHCNKTSIEPSWATKAHRGSVTDVVWDEDLFVTSSASEPILNFYRAGKSGASQRIAACNDAGIRNLAIDCSRKLVVAASDQGSLSFISYAGLFAHPGITSGGEGDHEGLQVQLVLQPHTGGITNLLLERSENSQWERLVSVGNDNTILCMDFDADRESKQYHGAGRGGAAAHAFVDFNGSLVTATDNTLAVWDVELMTRRNIPKKALEGHTDRINTVRYSKQYRRLITGSDDGTARFWDAHEMQPDEGAPKSAAPPDEMYTAAASIDLSMPVVCCSEPVGDLVAVGLKRQGARAGGVALLSVVTGHEVVAVAHLNIHPVAVHLLLEPVDESQPSSPASARPAWWVAPATNAASPSGSPQASPGRSSTGSATAGGASTGGGIGVAIPAPPTRPRHYFLLVQLRNGEVQLHAGIVGPTFAALPPRTLVHSHLEIIGEPEMSSAGDPLPILAELDTRYATPRVVLTSALNERTVKRESIQLSAGGKAEPARTAEWAVDVGAPISTLGLVNQSRLAVAVGTENGMTVFISQEGKQQFVAHFDGGIDDIANSAAVRAPRRRCFWRPPGQPIPPATPALETSPPRRMPGVSSIHATGEARSVAIGYRDGTVLVIDTVTNRMCRRLCGHGTVVNSAKVSPRHAKVISTSVAQVLRFDAVYGRHIHHQGATDATAVRAAFHN